jgi:hypothetical protein
MGQKLVSPATYWRRRVVVLAAGVAILGLPIWAVNEAFGGSQAPGQGLPRSHAGHVTGPGARSRPGRGPGQGQAIAGDAAHRGSRPQAHPRPTTSSPAASAAPAHRPGRHACAALTLRSARYRYGPGDLVTFVVGAASTGSRPCRVDLGSKFTSVVVASGGTPLWDSSSCLRGTGSRVVMLRRGAPAYLRVTWDQRTSLSGCPRQGKAIAAGTYTAAAFNGQLHSKTVTFVLSGRGAAAP